MPIPTIFTSSQISKLAKSSRIVTALQYSSSEVPQRSEEWFNLRKKKLTTSSFSTVLGFWESNRRRELWRDKVFSTDSAVFSSFAKAATNWGSTHEATAIDRYKAITGRVVLPLGFAVHPEDELNWLGGSPDGLLVNGGILEVKCPFNRGKPYAGHPWENVPYYYMPQVQGLMEIMDRNWVDLYCWTPMGSTLFRVAREPDYFVAMHEILNEFWRECVVPAKEAVENDTGGDDRRGEVDLDSFMPRSKHPLTKSLVAMSKKLAGDAKLLCRDTGGVMVLYR
ncbi:Exonuclease, phage-type [Zostera marina]|uniref:Exonuclease, phage-type n=1 Tax=Zostera marina TaxID=29655 RepID=A0A0K9NLT6_ZOSMR|nr:Exonuclease, phage-type [Zostera marina]